MTITEDMQEAILKIPPAAWAQAYDGDGQPCDGARLADITGMLDMSRWPRGMRVIVHKERSKSSPAEHLRPPRQAHERSALAVTR
jgi:hypothetical protein